MASPRQFAKESIFSARDPRQKLVLGDLWKDKPCALFFLRRLGCPICRSYIQIIETIREEYEKKGMQLVCLSFEAFGEGSDFDGSFARLGFWKGPVYIIDKRVYNELFGRKGFFSGLASMFDIDKEVYERSKKVPGNMKGDGFQLGGQFVVQKGGSMVLQHRQELFGDDAKPQDLILAFDACLKAIEKETNYGK